MPASAQDLPAFALKVLEWPKPELDDNREAESDEPEREEFIETDRNSFTFAPITPGDGRLIVESAYFYINRSSTDSNTRSPKINRSASKLILPAALAVLGTIAQSASHAFTTRA
jgi:hypothetical protein